MARPYTNADTVLFSWQMCRPGKGFSGYVGSGFRWLPGMDPEEGYPQPIYSMRSWYWLDEAAGLLGQTNVMSVPLYAAFRPREGEPGHFVKYFEWPWTNVTPARMKDKVRVRRELEVSAPDTFSEYGATVGAYVLGAGPDAGFNGYLGLPGSSEEAVRGLPEGSVPPRDKPWALEIYIKDGAGRWSCIPEYSTSSGALEAISLVKETHTDTDPATPNVLHVLRPAVAPPRAPLPADPAAWAEGGARGAAARTFAGPGGEVMIEEGLGAEWAPPKVASGHSLFRLPDATYLVCPDNILTFDGPVTFELGARSLGSSTGMKRVTLTFDGHGVWQEVRYETYD